MFRITRKLSVQLIHIGALAIDIAFIINTIIEESMFVVLDVVNAEVDRLRNAADEARRTYLRGKK